MNLTPTLSVATAFALWSVASNAGPFEDAVVEQYQSMGFQFIEIKEGITQTKVEAIMADGRKVEVIYDRETGEILKQENERADSDEIGRTGVEFDREGEDFLDDEDDEEDDEDDEDDEEDDDESDESDDDEDDDESDESDEDDDSDESDDDEDDES